MKSALSRIVRAASPQFNILYFLTMSEKKLITCPNCKKLISNEFEDCPYCNHHLSKLEVSFQALFKSDKISFVKPIITINVILMVLSYLLPFFLPSGIPSNRGFLGLVPAPSSAALSLLGWADPREIFTGSWWLLVTAMFLHGGLLHIAFNMMWVKDLGPQTEGMFSPFKMLIIFVISGVAGNLLAVSLPLISQVLFSYPMRFSPVIGASGAVFGLMGAGIAYGRKRGGLFGRQISTQFGKWALVIIFLGFLMPGVSNAAHIGGLIAGFLVGSIMPLRDTIKSKGLYRNIAFGIMGICGYSFFMMAQRLVNILDRI